MPRQVTLYRVLIASPSDVVGERKAVPEVIQSWNSVNSSYHNVVLEPVLWETHSTPEMGDRPQAIINRQLVESCDILIGIFWTRLGSYTGVVESGTVEEIEEFRKTGKPVLLYFSSIPVALNSVDTIQYNKLLEFREKCRKEGIISEYESIGDLREQLQRHITSTINSLLGKTDTDFDKTKEINSTHQTLQMFKSQYESFLRRLEAEWNAERESEPLDINNGKYILEKACSGVLDFRAQIVDDSWSELAKALDDPVKLMKTIQRHQLYLDGGESLREFWEKGNKIIVLLKKVPDIIDSISK